MTTEWKPNKQSETIICHRTQKIQVQTIWGLQLTGRSLVYFWWFDKEPGLFLFCVNISSLKWLRGDKFARFTFWGRRGKKIKRDYAGLPCGRCTCCLQWLSAWSGRRRTTRPRGDGGTSNWCPAAADLWTASWSFPWSAQPYNSATLIASWSI